jgi:hypothetical protein
LPLAFTASRQLQLQLFAVAVAKSKEQRAKQGKADLTIHHSPLTLTIRPNLQHYDYTAA